MSMIEEAAVCERKRLKVSQEEFGQIGGVSHDAISKAERGKGRIQPDVARNIAMKTNSARLYLSLIEEATGGVFGFPYLDGERVDLHRASVRSKLLEELREAINAVEVVDATNIPNLSDDLYMQRVRYSIMQVLDAYVASGHYIFRMVEEHGWTLGEIFDEHHMKLITKGYHKPDKNKKPLRCATSVTVRG